MGSLNRLPTSLFLSLIYAYRRAILILIVRDSNKKVSMSNSLILYSLLAVEKPTLQKIREVIEELVVSEDDVENLVALQEFLGKPSLSPLIEAVVAADPEADKVWRESLIEGFLSEIAEPFIQTLEGNEVQVVTLGAEPNALYIYMAGGMSSGDSPSSAFDIWYDFFEDTGDLHSGNPYREQIFSKMFVNPSEPFVPSGFANQNYISGVLVESKEPVLPPF